MWMQIIMWALWTALAHAQPAVPDQVATGEKLFTASCQICHGQAGVGSRAPTLRSSRLTLEYVTGVITNGKLVPANS